MHKTAEYIHSYYANIHYVFINFVYFLYLTLKNTSLFG